MASPRASRWRSTAQLFHALSDETRLAILGRLKNGEQCVCELTGVLDAAQSRLSFHMKTLKDAGLVFDRRHGRWIHYTLNPAALDAIAGFVESLRTSRGATEVAPCCKR